MRRYDDPVEVRKGPVNGAEGPEQFLWHGRLWQVREVIAHWVETGSWFESLTDQKDPLQEREVWRVAAAQGRVAGFGVFDLAFDWSAGDWRLARAAD